MAHSVTLNPTSITLEPGGSETVVATITGVPEDASATDVVEVVLGAVTAIANLGVTIDHPEPVVSVVSNSGAVYTIASPVQDGTVWTVDVSVSA